MAQQTDAPAGDAGSRSWPVRHDSPRGIHHQLERTVDRLFGRVGEGDLDRLAPSVPLSEKLGTIAMRPVCIATVRSFQ